MTDGPFGEAKEHLAGYLIVDCETHRARARDRGPLARRRTGVEVRPIMHEAGDGDVTAHAAVEDLLRQLAPQVLGALVRRYGHFDACEDAVQEALLAAATQWPEEGVPDNPRGWLITVASPPADRQLRSDRPAAGGRTAAALDAGDELLAPHPTTSRAGRGRHADTAVPVLPPGALPGVAGRADPARRRRPDHRPDRPRVPRPRGDDGPAHQPGEADDQGRRRAVQPAARDRARRPAAASCSTSST